MTTQEVVTVAVAIGGAGLGTRILMVLVQTRDAVRDLMRDVGTREPPTGLFRLVNHLSDQVNEHTEDLARLGFLRRRVGDLPQGKDA